MNKKSLLIFAAIILFLYFLNYLHPMSFGDDYLYSFVWQGHPMAVPLSENAVRISSWAELFVSQRLLYSTWGGRIVGQTLTQIFAWLGKDIFNFLNTIISILLVIEIYWVSNKGEVKLSFSPSRVCWIFFAIWAFSPGFNPVFFWLTGACIYLWPMVILLGFLIPYVKKYYSFHKRIALNRFFSIAMFLFGLLAGCGNENCICWILLILFLFLFTHRKFRSNELWMYTGVAGLISGYALLMLAPGNIARLHAEHGSAWFNIRILKENFYIFAVVLTFQLMLWHFNLKSLYQLSKRRFKRILQKDIILVKILCVSAIGMSAIMLFSPFFPPRSGFPGTIQLIIATSILIRLQDENSIELIPIIVRKFLLKIGILYFVISASITIQFFYETYMQMSTVINGAKQIHKNSENQILIVNPFKNSGSLKDLLSGYHLSYFNLSEDENNWVNVAFARYYGIKGIRMVDEEKKDSAF